MDEETQQKLDEQTENLYAALGRFAVEFEHVCHYLRLVIMTILDKEGLKNPEVMQIILADLTAEPLRALVASLIPQTHKLSQTDEKIISKILTGIQELIKKRNDVLHGTWFIGWASFGETECKLAPGVKFKKDKTGVSTKSFNWTVSEFEKLTEEAIQLRGLLAGLNGCFSGGFTIEENFNIESDGTVAGLRPFTR